MPAEPTAPGPPERALATTAELRATAERYYRSEGATTLRVQLGDDSGRRRSRGSAVGQV